MLDAPVSGGDTGAINGTLSIMVGGEADVFATQRELLQAMGQSVTHVGPNGMGQTVKLCNQIVGLSTLLAVSEGLLFAARAGADLEKTIEAVSGGAAGSWMIQNVAPKIIRRDFAPGFMIKLAQKDLRLVLEAADEHSLPLPVTSLLRQLFAAVEAQGGSEEGIHALVKALEALSCTEVHQD